MEFAAKKLLMERLDKSLLDHAAALSSDSSGPTILGVYKLQGLAELHCYLKTAHEFNAAEVDGLLRFADPLEVAKACWRTIPMSTVSPSVNCWEQYGRVSDSRWRNLRHPRKRYLCGSV